MNGKVRTSLLGEDLQSAVSFKMLKLTFLAIFLIKKETWLKDRAHIGLFLEPGKFIKVLSSSLLQAKLLLRVSSNCPIMKIWGTWKVSGTFVEGGSKQISRKIMFLNLTCLCASGKNNLYFKTVTI